MWKTLRWVSLLLLMGAGTNLEQQIIKAYGEPASVRFSQWKQHLLALEGQDRATQLQQVNRFFNQFHEVEDSIMWSEEDYWASAPEFIGSGAGDCEDFAIAKFDSLLKLGVSQQRMRLIYVKIASRPSYHVVLAYYPSDDKPPLILDNLNPELLPADKRADLQPIFSFNAAKLWLNRNRYSPTQEQDISSFSRWRQVLERRKPRQPNQVIEARHDTF